MNQSKKYKVDNAIILSAGFGSRCVPLTYETPKGLIRVKGKPMLEQQIEQLREKGITEIIIVVGYLKEKFEYLKEKYGVILIENPEHSIKNNLSSLYYALPYLKNSYILVSDNWIETNIFHTYENHSWVSCVYQEGPTEEWCITVSEDNRITKIDIGGKDSHCMMGPSFFTEDMSKEFQKYLLEYYHSTDADDYYWEHIVKHHLDTLPVYLNAQTNNVFEFESLEELRQYDTTYLDNSGDPAMEYISNYFQRPQSAVHDILPIKTGLTNNSFIFSLDGNRYVFRLPGKGSEKLIDRKSEKTVYDHITPLYISDEIVHFDADTGIKITKYYENAVVSDPFNDSHLKDSMLKVKSVHNAGIQIPQRFDIKNKISYYLNLTKDITATAFNELEDTKAAAQKLLKHIERLDIPETLCHGDYLHTNSLILSDGTCKLIDWEYSGMADPIMDISMYCIFAEFDRRRIDLALELYLERTPESGEYSRLYLYVALGGFLWSMWGLYQESCGQKLGEYTLTMYQYMLDYTRILTDETFI